MFAFGADCFYAVFSIAAAFLVRHYLTPWLGDRAPYMFFVPAVMLVTVRSGLLFGTAAMALGMWVGKFFIFPGGPVSPESARFLLLLITPYVLITMWSILVIHALQNARRQLRRVQESAWTHQQKLKQQVVEKKQLEESLRLAHAELQRYSLGLSSGMLPKH